MSRVTDTLILTDEQFKLVNNLMKEPGLCALCRVELGKDRALLSQPYSSFFAGHKGKFFVGAICPKCQGVLMDLILKLKSGETSTIKKEALT